MIIVVLGKLPAVNNNTLSVLGLLCDWVSWDCYGSLRLVVSMLLAWKILLWGCYEAYSNELFTKHCRGWLSSTLHLLYLYKFSHACMITIFFDILFKLKVSALSMTFQLPMFPVYYLFVLLCITLANYMHVTMNEII